MEKAGGKRKANREIEQLTSPKEKYERNRNKLEKINMELNVWFRPRGRSDLSFCPILREMQPRCNKFSPITLLDCTDSPLLPFSHRISDIPNQFECKFYTLASLKYCDAMVIGCLTGFRAMSRLCSLSSTAQYYISLYLGWEI